jgi:hypothetical protein
MFVWTAIAIIDLQNVHKNLELCRVNKLYMLEKMYIRNEVKCSNHGHIFGKT